MMDRVQSFSHDGVSLSCAYKEDACDSVHVSLYLHVTHADADSSLIRNETEGSRETQQWRRMRRTSRVTFTDASIDGVFEAAFCMSTSLYSFSGYAPTGATVTLDTAMPLTVMLAVGLTARMPFFVTASTAP
jgi:hypothetical protein